MGKISSLFSIIEILCFSFISEIPCSYPYFFLELRKIRSLILYLSRLPVLSKSFFLRRTRFPTLVCTSTPPPQNRVPGVCLQIRCTYTVAAIHLQHAHCDRLATADDRAYMQKEHQAISMPSHRSLAVSIAEHPIGTNLCRCVTQKFISCKRARERILMSLIVRLVKLRLVGTAFNRNVQWY